LERVKIYLIGKKKSIKIFIKVSYNYTDNSKQIESTILSHTIFLLSYFFHYSKKNGEKLSSDLIQVHPTLIFQVTLPEYFTKIVKNDKMCRKQSQTVN